MQKKIIQADLNNPYYQIATAKLKALLAHKLDLKKYYINYLKKLGKKIDTPVHSSADILARIGAQNYYSLLALSNQLYTIANPKIFLDLIFSFQDEVIFSLALHCLSTEQACNLRSAITSK
ncbi:MAG: hypothetical protein KKA19_07630 [Candidatus Margulisbacteria bacterium]|nr:hypothetical protein [Candidatus Margulisiibacteriota bacterium]